MLAYTSINYKKPKKKKNRPFLTFTQQKDQKAKHQKRGKDSFSFMFLQIHHFAYFMAQNESSETPKLVPMRTEMVCGTGRFRKWGRCHGRRESGSSLDGAVPIRMGSKQIFVDEVCSVYLCFGLKLFYYLAINQDFISVIHYISF